MAVRLDLKLSMASWDGTGGAGGGGGGGQVVFPSPIGPTGTVPNPTMVLGAVTVLPAFLAATGAVYNPTMLAGGQIIVPDAIGPTSQVFNVTIDRGNVNVLPSFLAAAGSVFNPTVTNSGSYSTEAQAYFTAFTTDPGTTRKNLLATLIDGLVSDGVWSDIDALYLLASHDSQSALLNVKNPAQTATTVNSPTFTTDLGYNGNGSTSYVLAAQNISGGAYGFAQNDAHVHAYCNNQAGSVGAAVHTGLEGFSNRISVAASSTGGAAQNARVNTAGDVNVGNSSGTRKGWRCGTRTAASGGTAHDSQLNGAAGGNAATASSTFSTDEQTVGRVNTTYTSDRFAAFGSGTGLTQTQMTALHSRLHTYFTAIGANY